MAQCCPNFLRGVCNREDVDCKYDHSGKSLRKFFSLLLIHEKDLPTSRSLTSNEIDVEIERLTLMNRIFAIASQPQSILRPCETKDDDDAPLASLFSWVPTIMTLGTRQIILRMNLNIVASSALTQKLQQFSDESRHDVTKTKVIHSAQTKNIHSAQTHRIVEESLTNVIGQIRMWCHKSIVDPSAKRTTMSKYNTQIDIVTFTDHVTEPVITCTLDTLVSKMNQVYTNRCKTISAFR